MPANEPFRKYRNVRFESATRLTNRTSADQLLLGGVVITLRLSLPTLGADVVRCPTIAAASFAVALASLIAGISPARAHATLDHASPPIDGTVRSAPQEILLTFTERLEPAFSMIEVTDSGGTRVDQGKTEVNGNTMRVGLKVLPEGHYRVHWRAITADTHRVEGHFTFNVDSR
jgi:copper resistance protein C